jgi:hypothetical protein
MTIRKPACLQRHRQPGNLAITSAVVAGLLVAGLSGCATESPEHPSPTASATQRTEPSAIASASPVAPSHAPGAQAEGLFFHPEIGQCLDVRKDRGAVPESIVACDEVHDDEAYAKFNLDGTEYPGETATAALADDGCRARFDDFIGIAYEDSVFEFLAIHPSEQSWNAYGDRRVTCLVWYPEDSVTGSLEDAGY